MLNIEEKNKLKSCYHHGFDFQGIVNGKPLFLEIFRKVNDGVPALNYLDPNKDEREHFKTILALALSYECDEKVRYYDYEKMISCLDNLFYSEFNLDNFMFRQINSWVRLFFEVFYEFICKLEFDHPEQSEKIEKVKNALNKALFFKKDLNLQDRVNIWILKSNVILNKNKNGLVKA